MRTVRKGAPLKAEAEWDLARGFVDLKLWPYLVEHEPDSSVGAHYHRTDEELQVVRGVMTFFAVGGAGDGIAVGPGERAIVPEGTVHRVTIGPSGVTYVMGLRRPMPLDRFSVSLPVSQDVSIDSAAELVETNYHIAEAEEMGEKAKSFFEKHLSSKFVFVGAGGDQSMNRDKFIEGLEARRDKRRMGTGLRLRRIGAAIAASMVVSTGDGGEYLNLRLFEREADGYWRCVRWSNAVAKAPKPMS